MVNLNHFFKDNKININNDIVAYIDKYPALEKQYKMFEPEKNHSYSGISSNLEPIRTAWLAIANEVRTRIMTSEKGIFIPELSL